MDDVVVHTDGGCRGNPGKGAWAAILQCNGKERELVGTEAHTTNNRMELTASIEALSALKRRCRVKVLTDSEYLKRGITEWLPNWIAKGWRTSAKKPVLNRDLWERLDALTKQHDVTWAWVRGHDGDEFNERCDQLVNGAMDAMG